MHPVLLGLGVAGGGFGLYKALTKPRASNFQTQQIQGPGGVPVKVLTPIPSEVTPAQRQAKPARPPSQIPSQTAIPQTVAARDVVSTVYAPPAVITQTAPDKFEPAPIVQTPTGTSSVAISSIMDVQRALNTLGFLPKLVEDNRLGPKTTANIRAFQSKSGLVIDGNAGPATKSALSSALVGLTTDHPAAKLAAAAADRPAPSKPVYSTKSQTELGPYDTAPNRAGANADLSSPQGLQHALNLLGASPQLVEDGKLGPRSVAAIKSFQLSHGLVADGVAGPKTRQALSAAIGQPAAIHGSWG